MTAFEREFQTCTMRAPGSDKPGNCDLCGKRLKRNKDGSISKARRWCSKTCSYTVTRNHLWSWARDQAIQRDGRKCVKPGCGQTWGLEVNHIKPLVGRGYHAGCVHHLDNLETVCKVHHTEITKMQREERKNAKP